MNNVTYYCYDLLTDGEMKELERISGKLVDFVITNPTGHYVLELGVPAERVIFQKILETATEERITRHGGESSLEEGHLEDMSQNNDYGHFRNQVRLLLQLESADEL
jgi:hypothetical protein